MIKSYKDLTVWQKAYHLVLTVYKVTLSFPRHELFGLVTQLRRSTVSIVANIAEGHYRRSTKEYIHFLNIARASSAELDTHIHIAKDLGYLDLNRFTEITTQIEEISKMLFALQNKLK